jgi:hypothetical protein
VIIVGLITVNACSEKNQHLKNIEEKKKHYQSLKKFRSLPVDNRIQLAPSMTLDKLIAFDKSNNIITDGYTAILPNLKEVNIFKKYLTLLPKSHQDIINEKLLAIYFIDNFSGAALIDWVVGEDKEIYFYLFLNRKLLDTPLDDWLTYKSNSIYKKGTTSIKVDTNTDHLALLYALLHEGAHMLDYQYQLTPYTDNTHYYFIEKKVDPSEFTRGVWDSINKALGDYGFLNEVNINTYRMYSNRKPINNSLLKLHFSKLKESPFVSFYSTNSWSDDFADASTYFILESRLEGEINISLLENGSNIESFKPTNEPAFLKRKIYFKNIYSEN